MSEDVTKPAEAPRHYYWPNFTIEAASNGWLLREEPDDYKEQKTLTVGATVDELLEVIRLRVMELARLHPPRT